MTSYIFIITLKYYMNYLITLHKDDSSVRLLDGLSII